VFLLVDLLMKGSPPNRKLRAGLALLALLALCAVGAGFVAPYDPAAQDRELFFAPPASIRMQDAAGRWQAPFVYALRLADAPQQRYSETTAAVYPIQWFVSGAPYRLLGFWECRTHLFGVAEPARVFLLGSDGLGRDVFSRIVHGARLALGLAGGALLLAVPLGLLVGSLAGFYGGRFDFVSMRLVELLLAVPALYLIIGLRSALPLDLPPERVFFALMLVIAAFGWANLARVIRGATLALRGQDFLLAARALGASDARLIVRHLWPNLLGVILTQAALAAPGFILAEVTLSYLGLGVPEPLASWGGMLAAAGGWPQLQRYWWNLLPGAAIFVTSLTFYLLAEGIREWAQPRPGQIDAAPHLW
jgi:peptide/nickel transport system permease protein